MEQIELSYTNRAVTTIFILGGLEVTIGGGLTMVEGEELNNLFQQEIIGGLQPPLPSRGYGTVRRNQPERQRGNLPTPLVYHVK